MTPVKTSKAVERFLEEFETWSKTANPDNVGAACRYIFRQEARDYLRNVPDPIIDMVTDCWIEEGIIPPNIDELKEWCGAAMAVRPYLERRLLMDTSDYDKRALEPNDLKIVKG